MVETNSIDIAVSFDTTGSMYPCITEVRRKLVAMVDTLFSNIPALRMSIIAHGDYCDDGAPYVVSILDFTDRKEELVQFINSVKNTSGGDSDECYELVLNKARSLNWQSGRSKALVVIGDANPHFVGYTYRSHRNTFRNTFDWVNESTLLAEMGVQIYSCHAMASIRSSSYDFYSKLAEIGRGYYVTLAQFSSLPTLLMGIMYNQNSPEQFIEFAKQVETNNEMTRDLYTSFTAMGATELTPMSAPANRTYVHKTGMSTMRDVPTELTAVPPSRFQVFNIDAKQDIRAFINNQHVMFKPGRGFYQLSKSVKVQQHKEIILVDKVTRDMFTGAPVRKLLKLLPQTVSGGTTQRLSSHDIPKEFDVFIQSTSYNRALLPGTLFMYEMDDWDKDIGAIPVASAKLSKVKKALGTTSGRISSATTATCRTPSKPEIAFLGKRSKITSPKGSVCVGMDFTAIESRVTALMAEEKLPVVDDTPAPEKFAMDKTLWLYRKAHPKTTWAGIAKVFNINPVSRVRNMIRRYESHVTTVEKEKLRIQGLREAAKVPTFMSPPSSGISVVKDTPCPQWIARERDIHLYRLMNPKMAWKNIAKHFGYTSASGASKAAQRYTEWLSKNRAKIVSTPVEVVKHVPPPVLSPLDGIRFNPVPENLKDAKVIYVYRLTHPEVTWKEVANVFSYKSATGVSLAAKRFAKWLAENPVKDMPEIPEDLKHTSKVVGVNKTFPSLEKSKRAFSCKQHNPTYTWDKIAACTGFKSGGGAQKAAKRYEEYCSRT